MTDAFATAELPTTPTSVAPDGSDVRVLLGLPAGGMAHFEFTAGSTSRAVRHRTVSELWFFLSGAGELWRKGGEREEVVIVGPGTCISLPVGTEFQLRVGPTGPVVALGVTMPPWPGVGEAIMVAGNPAWTASVTGGPGGTASAASGS